MTSALEENSMTNVIARVLIIVAHPDDAEAGAGGMVTKLVTQGSEVSYVIVTNGHTGRATGR